MTFQTVLIDGVWRDADTTQAFRAENPATCEPLEDEYPVSSWHDCDAALTAAVKAAKAMREDPRFDTARYLLTDVRGVTAFSISIVGLEALANLDAERFFHVRRPNSLGAPLAAGHQPHALFVDMHGLEIVQQAASLAQRRKVKPHDDHDDV